MEDGSQATLFDDIFLLRRNLLDRVCWATEVAPSKEEKQMLAKVFVSLKR